MSFLNGIAQSTIGQGMDSLAGRLSQPQQPARPAIPTPADPNAPQQSPIHPMADATHPFWSALGQILQTGAPPAGDPEQQSAAIPPQGIPAAAPMQSPIQPQPAQVLQAGGIVTQPEFTRAGPLGSGVIPASTEGQVLTMEGGGYVPDMFANPMGGPAPQVAGRAAGIASGIAQGQVLGHNLRQAMDQHRTRQAAADYASNVVGIDASNPQQPPPEHESILGHARDAVEGFFQHLHDGSLNDKHTPNGQAGVPADPTAAGSPQPAPVSGSQQAIPTGAAAGAPPSQPAAPAQPQAAPAQGAAPAVTPPATPQQAPTPATGAQGASPAAAAPSPAATQQAATAMAVKAAAADPNANAGVPQDSPAESGKPHSLTTDYWQESQHKLQAAVRAAAMAGEDPNQVYQSLTAMRTAHFQGQIVRQLSTASVGLQSGNMAAVKQALSNVNYYLPNGQGITFKTATAADADADPSGQTVAGQTLMYRNPMKGLYGHEKEPDYTSVTQQHLQLLATAALEPRNVVDSILKTYSAQAVAQKEMLQAQGEYNTGLGRLKWGDALQSRAQVEVNMQKVERYLKYATGLKNEAEAGYYNRRPGTTGAGAGPRITLAGVQAAQKAAQQAVDNLVQGEMTTVPVLDKTGDPSLSPAAGKSVHDATRIPTIFQGATPDQQQQASSLAAALGGANAGLHDPGTVAELAMRIVRAEGQKAPPTHIDPATHNIAKDIIYDQKQNTIHVWVGNGYKNAYIRPNIIDEDDRSPLPSDGGGGSSGGDSGHEDNSGMNNEP